MTPYRSRLASGDAPLPVKQFLYAALNIFEFVFLTVGTAGAIFIAIVLLFSDVG